MNIVKRNFFRLLRFGAFNDFEPIEPMSLYKWGKLTFFVQNSDVEGVAAKGLRRYANEQPGEIPQGAIDLFFSEIDIQKVNSIVQLPQTQLSNIVLRRRLSKIRRSAQHESIALATTLNTLNIIVYNIWTTLNSTVSLNGILCLGKYVASQEENIDFALLDKWLRRLHIQRMAQLQGCILTDFFNFDAEQLPFVKDKEGSVGEIVEQSLSELSSRKHEDIKFWQGKSGFVHNNTDVLGRKIWKAMKYANYAPIEATSNFLGNLAHSLSNIEE